MNKKSEKFRRLGAKRVTNMIKHLRLIGNLANKKNYTFTKDEAQQMFEAIEHELEQTKKKFSLNYECLIKTRYICNKNKKLHKIKFHMTPRHLISRFYLSVLL